MSTNDDLLQRISSEPSVQSSLPLHTYDLGIHSPLLQVASSYWHAWGLLVDGGSTVQRTKVMNRNYPCCVLLQFFLKIA